MTGDESHSTPPDERTERELAALADGSLQGARREALEARVAASPALRAALERQRSALAALRGLAPPAPPGLRTRAAGDRRRAGRRRGHDRAHGGAGASLGRRRSHGGRGGAALRAPGNRAIPPRGPPQPATARG